MMENAVKKARNFIFNLLGLALGGVVIAMPCLSQGTFNDWSFLGLTDSEVPQHFEQEPTPKAGSPNVIYILLDDTGYSDVGVYGSEIDTPVMDRLANEGLRYNNFHSRAICSPTRAALLTGRNSHSVGVANVTNMLSGYSHGQGRISHAAATIAEILQSKGYRTYVVGKWHLAPLSMTSSRDQWPVSRGFDQFYGFLDGMTDQYYPDLVVDNTPIDLDPPENYHLSEDLVDRAISYIAAEKGVSPDRPFFLYLSFGATHAPHHVPASYRDKYLPVYEKGWDEIRAQRFARQKSLGLIPKNAELAPLNPDVRPWSDLSEVEREVYAHFEATFAGFLEHTDEQIGRLVAFLEKAGQLDNTLIVLMSDNGGSIEGHQTGTLNEVSSLNRIPETADEMQKRLEEMGSETTYQNYPSGWAQASNTPFKFYKTTVWDGGIRTPLIIHYPSGIEGPGGIRSQFVDVIDVTPTVLDILGIEPPDSFKGVPQMPMAGKSFRATLNDVDAPPARDTQYFELLGQRAIWHQGWKAITEHTLGQDFSKDVWHLYNLENDFSGLHDVSEKHPDVLEDLKTRWWVEASKHGVLPLVNAPLYASFDAEKGKNVSFRYKTSREPRSEYVFYPEGAPLLRADAPQLGVGSYSIAVITKPLSGDESGVLVAFGDRFGGYSLYVENGHLVFELSNLGKTSRLRSETPFKKGDTELKYVFERSDRNGGKGTLFYDGRRVASGRVECLATNLSSVSTFSVGRDSGSPVSAAYSGAGEFAFPEGVIQKIIVKTEK